MGETIVEIPVELILLYVFISFLLGFILGLATMDEIVTRVKEIQDKDDEG